MHRMYLEGFSDIAKVKNCEYHIKLEDNAMSVVHSVRKIAIPLRGRYEKELKNMVGEVTIAPVGDCESDWVNSFVI